MEDDIDAALLAELPPASWAAALRRQEVLRRHAADLAAGRGDTAATARALGLAETSVPRLVRAFEHLVRSGVAPTNRQGSVPRLAPGIPAILADVRRELGGRLPTRALALEAARRCEDAGLDVPAERTLRLHLMGFPAADLESVLGRSFAAVVDACPLLLDVETAAGTTTAVFCAVMRGADGHVLAQHLSAGPPTGDATARLLRAAAAQLPTGAAICATDAVELPRDDPEGVTVDRVAGLGLRRSSAVLAVMGTRLGKIDLRPRPRARGRHRPQPTVPFDLARRVVAEVLRIPEAYSDG